MRYATATAFRMALEQRINRLCDQGSSAIQRTRRRIAIERFLARLQQPPHNPWVLKGAFALYLRFGNRARTTKDLDIGIDPSLVRRIPSSRSEIAQHLREAAATQIDDFFAFTIKDEGEQIDPEPDTHVYRFNAQGSLDDRLFEEFRIDVAIGAPLVAPAEELPEGDTLAFAAIAPRRFRAISLPQHFAEKLHALTFPWKDRENTRVKDLVDLVLILELNPPEPGAVRDAIKSVFGRRERQSIPLKIQDPPDSWRPMYARLALGPGILHAQIGEAVEFLRRYYAKVIP